MEGKDGYSLPTIWDNGTPACKLCFNEREGGEEEKERDRKGKSLPAPSFLLLKSWKKQTTPRIYKAHSKPRG